jgi:DNA-binding LacI/PurR family transcriptional regulator
MEEKSNHGVPPRHPAKVSNLQDLADLAGVSRATASRALNDNPRIALKTRQKIQALAQKHGYSINRRARDLRLQRNSVVAVVFMLDIRSKQHMSDLFFLDMLGGIADALAARDYDLLLAHAPVVDASDLADSRIMSQSDGVIFIGQERQHEQLNKLAGSECPIVVWGHPVTDKLYTVVGGDNQNGGRQAADHLLRSGRRRIAFFGNTANPENAARFSGYSMALADHGIELDSSLQFDIPFSMEKARDTISQLLEERVDFDAVVCVSDVMALATISAIQRHGLRVPNDIAVTGYDDIAIAAYCSPTLTTVQQNIGQAGEVLVDTLMRLIDGETPGDTILPTQLVVRESSGGSAD